VRPIISLLFLAAAASAACSEKRAVPLDQLRTIAPERVWVTGHDQSVVVMYEPKLVRDSLVGYIGRYKEKLPTAGVKEVRMQSPAHVRTALLVGGLAVGFTAFVVMVAGSGESVPIVSTTGPPGLCDIAPDQPVCTGVPE
jgi:hypothetical protein